MIGLHDAALMVIFTAAASMAKLPQREAISACETPWMHGLKATSMTLQYVTGGKY